MSTRCSHPGSHAGGRSPDSAQSSRRFSSTSQTPRHVPCVGWSTRTIVAATSSDERARASSAVAVWILAMRVASCSASLRAARSRSKISIRSSAAASWPATTWRIPGPARPKQSSSPHAAQSTPMRWPWPSIGTATSERRPLRSRTGSRLPAERSSATTSGSWLVSTCPAGPSPVRTAPPTVSSSLSPAAARAITSSPASFASSTATASTERSRRIVLSASRKAGSRVRGAPDAPAFARTARQSRTRGSTSAAVARSTARRSSIESIGRSVPGDPATCPRAPRTVMSRAGPTRGPAPGRSA